MAKTHATLNSTKCMGSRTTVLLPLKVPYAASTEGANEKLCFFFEQKREHAHTFLKKLRKSAVHINLLQAKASKLRAC